MLKYFLYIICPEEKCREKLYYNDLIGVMNDEYTGGGANKQ